MNPKPSYFLGLPLTPVPGGCSTANVVAHSQASFQPAYLIVPKSMAPSFHIVDIKIGKISQFISPDSIAAEVFSGDVVVLRDRIVEASPDLPLPWKLDPCPAGTYICVTVMNITACALNFAAAIAGAPIE